MPVSVDEEDLLAVVDNGNELLSVLQSSVDAIGTVAGETEADRILAQAAAASAGASANAALGTTTNSPSYKAPVLVTATTNVTLSGTSQTIDGKAGYGVDARIGLVAQNDQTKNGIWLTKAGAWVRATDADTAAEVANMVFWALDGDANYGREFRLATTETITLETTKLPFTAREFGHSNPFQRASGTGVLVGDSNRNGRTAYYTALPLELTGVGRPHQAWTYLNQAQNGSQLHGWRVATEASSYATAPAPADYTGTTNPYTDLYQVVKAAPDLILFSLGINDYNTVANRAGTPGTNFGANFDWAINFLLANNPNRDGVIVLETPAPYGSIDFVSGPTTTGWGDDAATYGNANAAENAAYFSRLLRSHYLRWKGRNPRVIVHDTAEIFNPGSTADPTLHRCDAPKLNCLDPIHSKVRFLGSITSDVLTVTAIYGSGTLAADYPVTTDAYGAANTRVIQAFGTDGTTGTGGVGTYKLSAGSNVSAAVMKIPAGKMDDSLHFSDTGARRILESYGKQFGIEGRRALRSFTNSAMGTDPFYTIFQNGYASKLFYYVGKSPSGSNTLVNVIPSPESVFTKSDPSLQIGPSRNAPLGALHFAEYALLMEDLGRIRWLSNIRGNRIKVAVLGGTGTIYTPSSVTLSSVSTTITFYHTIQFNDLNLTTEAATGLLLVWVEDAAGIPFLNKPISAIMPPGTAAVASTAIANPLSSSGTFGFPIRRVSASRFAATDGAMTIDVGFANQAADNRLVDGSISTASLPYVIGTITLSGTALSASMTANQTNIDAAVAAGISWPAAHGTAASSARWKGTYRLTLIPSITITKPITVTISD